MSLPAQKKYLVAVTRPVIQSIIIEVEADDEDEAADKAFQQAFEIGDELWSGGFEPDSYGHDIVSVVEQGQEPARAQEESLLHDRISDIKYLLLRGDRKLGEGAMLFQPWLHDRSSLFVADVCKDWLDDIQLLADEGVEGLAEWIENPMVDAAPIPPEVIARLPWLSQKNSRNAGNS